MGFLESDEFVTMFWIWERDVWHNRKGEGSDKDKILELGQIINRKIRQEKEGFLIK